MLVAACGGKSSAARGEFGETTTTSTGAEPGTGGAVTGSTGGQSLDELGECNPLDDACPEGEYCQYLDRGTQCIPEGDTPRDEVCEDTTTCERGSICLYGSALYGKHCQEPCPLGEEPWTVCFIGRHTCFVAVDEAGNDLPFGVCRYSE
jgi:hypothetical protein